VEDESESLGGGEVLEHDQHRQANRVGELRLLGRVLLGDIADDRFDVIGAVWVLVARLAGSEQVEGDAADHRGQPGPQVVDLVGVGAAQPQPGLLHRIVGLARRAQHPVGHGVQVGTVVLKALCEELLIAHVTSSRSYPS
jgi:hypothetical protein